MNVNRGSGTNSTNGDQPERPSNTGKQGDPDVDGVKKMDISPAQVAGGALASVTAAFLGGQLGVAGTIGGAALTSVVITVGGAVYQRSLETTKNRANAAAAKAALKRAKHRPLLSPPPDTTPAEEPTRRIHGTGPSRHGTAGMHWPGGERVVEPGGPPSPDADSTRRIGPPRIGADERTRRLHWDGTRYVPVPPAGSGEEGTGRASTRHEPGPRSTSARARRIRWTAVAATSGLAFLLCMLVVTGFEGITGQPLSGGEKGTTVGHLFRPGVPQEGPVEPAPGKPVPESDPVSSNSRPPSGPPRRPVSSSPLRRPVSSSPSSSRRPGRPRRSNRRWNDKIRTSSNPRGSRIRLFPSE